MLVEHQDANNQEGLPVIEEHNVEMMELSFPDIDQALNGIPGDHPRQPTGPEQQHGEGFYIDLQLRLGYGVFQSNLNQNSNSNPGIGGPFIGLDPSTSLVDVREFIAPGQGSPVSINDLSSSSSDSGTGSGNENLDESANSGNDQFQNRRVPELENMAFTEPQEEFSYDDLYVSDTEYDVNDEMEMQG
jgi:hypothetical protein